MTSTHAAGFEGVYCMFPSSATPIFLTRELGPKVYTYGELKMPSRIGPIHIDVTKREVTLCSSATAKVSHGSGWAAVRKPAAAIYGAEQGANYI